MLHSSLVCQVELSSSLSCNIKFSLLQSSGLMSMMAETVNPFLLITIK